MDENPMMKCGHSANAVHVQKDGTKTPCCVICSGIHEGAHEIDEFYVIPTGRMAKCDYYGKMPRKNECNYGGKSDEPCACIQPSNTNLPFFSRKEGAEFDSFYCGCHSWD